MPTRQGIEQTAVHLLLNQRSRKQNPNDSEAELENASVLGEMAGVKEVSEHHEPPSNYNTLISASASSWDRAS
jgi:hypothetical protein